MTEYVVAEPIDVERATPDLMAALARAQEAARTVAKRGYNQHARYNYARAEDMIAAGRAARRGTGLALVTSWRLEPREDNPPLLTLEWVLTHASGGYMTGAVVAPVQRSKRNGGDKQVAALATYLEGFVERGLMRLDRDEVPPEEDVDARDDERELDRQPAAPKTATARSRPAAKQAEPDIDKIRRYLLHLHAQGRADDDAIARAAKAAHMTTEEVRAWLPAPKVDAEQPPGLAEVIGAIEDAPDGDSLVGVVYAFRDVLREHAQAAMPHVLRHAERTGTPVAEIDEAMRMGEP